MVKTSIQDVLPDGTITKAGFTVENIITIAITRSNPDEAFTIEKCDIISKDEEKLTSAIQIILDTMKERGIELLIPIANAG